MTNHGVGGTGSPKIAGEDLIVNVGANLTYEKIFQSPPTPNDWHEPKRP